MHAYPGISQARPCETEILHWSERHLCFGNHHVANRTSDVHFQRQTDQIPAATGHINEAEVELRTSVDCLPIWSDTVNNLETISQHGEPALHSTGTTVHCVAWAWAIEKDHANVL